MYAQSSPRIGAGVCTLALCALLVVTSGCRDVAPYESAKSGDTGGLSDAAADLESLDEASVPPGDTGPPDVIPDLAPDTWPPIAPVNCNGDFWMPTELRIDQADEAAILALPQSAGWLLAWIRGNDIFTRRLDIHGQPLAPALSIGNSHSTPRHLTLVQDGTHGPVLLWSELTTPATQCKRRLLAYYLDAKAGCQHVHAQYGLAEPRSLRRGGQLWVVATNEFYLSCNDKHTKLNYARLSLSAGGCTFEGPNTSSSDYTAASPAWNTIAPSLVDADDLDSSNATLVRIYTSSADPNDGAAIWELHVHMATFSGSQMYPPGPRSLVGTLTRSTGRYSALSIGSALWLAWDDGASTASPRLALLSASTSNDLSQTPTMLSAAADPALFELERHGVRGLVHLDTTTQGLVVQRLDVTASTVSQSQAIRPENSVGTPRNPRWPQVAASEHALGVAWLEDEKSSSVLYFRLLQCLASN